MEGNDVEPVVQVLCTVPTPNQADRALKKVTTGVSEF